MDLYGRLEELQGMTRVLIDDVTRLKPLVGGGNPDPTEEEKTYRRAYVRAVFALIEAFAEQHRRLLVELADAVYVTLPERQLHELREIKIVLQDGVPQERRQYLRLYEKIKTVYNAAGTGFGQALKITFGDENWETFLATITIRDRLTHPKRYLDVFIHEADLQQVYAASEWFKALQNEFVRVARAHREQQRW
jgi:hypothetical protein